MAYKFEEYCPLQFSVNSQLFIQTGQLKNYY